MAGVALAGGWSARSGSYFPGSWGSIVQGSGPWQVRGHLADQPLVTGTEAGLGRAGPGG